MAPYVGCVLHVERLVLEHFQGLDPDGVTCSSGRSIDACVVLSAFASPPHRGIAVDHGATSAARDGRMCPRLFARGANHPWAAR